MSQRSACFQLTAFKKKNTMSQLVYFESLSFLNAVTQFYLLFILLFFFFFLLTNDIKVSCDLFRTEAVGDFADVVSRVF